MDFEEGRTNLDEFQSDKRGANVIIKTKLHIPSVVNLH